MHAKNVQSDLKWEQLIRYLMQNQWTLPSEVNFAYIQLNTFFLLSFSVQLEKNKVCYHFLFILDVNF